MRSDKLTDTSLLMHSMYESNFALSHSNCTGFLQRACKAQVRSQARPYGICIAQSSTVTSFFSQVHSCNPLSIILLMLHTHSSIIDTVQHKQLTASLNNTFKHLQQAACINPSLCVTVPTEMCEKEKGKSSKKCPALPKTVTVVGGDDNRVRQYTVQHCMSQQKGDKDKQSPITLPELTSNSSSRKPSIVSVDKLPVAVLQTNSCAPDSEQSPTYLCLPSPYLNVYSLLEGSGELACSESSVLSSSDSEHERATSPAMLPARRPIRQFRRGAQHHPSRSHIKDCKPEQFQSYSQSGRSGK
jgi:hypothetical protein